MDNGRISMMASALANSPMSRCTGPRFQKKHHSVGVFRASKVYNVDLKTFDLNRMPMQQSNATYQHRPNTVRRQGVCSALADSVVVRVQWFKKRKSKYHQRNITLLIRVGITGRGFP